MAFAICLAIQENACDIIVLGMCLWDPPGDAGRHEDTGSLLGCVFFSLGVQSDGFRLFLRRSVGIDVKGRPCVALVSQWASNFDLWCLPWRCVQIWSLRLEVILDIEGGADGSGTQDLLEIFDAIKPKEGAVLHEKLDSLRRLVLQRDYDMQGWLDKQIARLLRDFIMPAHARNSIFPAESPVTERPIRHRKQARTMLRDRRSGSSSEQRMMRFQDVESARFCLTCECAVMGRC